MDDTQRLSLGLNSTQQALQEGGNSTVQT